MSSPLAVGAVTAVMKGRLDRQSAARKLVENAVRTFQIDTGPPDLIAAEKKNIINLFLFKSTENGAWRNAKLPTRNGNGDRVANSPLALNLVYFVTTTGSHDYYADILLGFAMHVFHESPVLTRKTIRNSLIAPAGNNNWPQDIDACGLADQIEQIKIAPKTMSVDELSRIWGAFQAPYRSTAVYEVSVVLIEAGHPTQPVKPVLTIGENDRGVRSQPNMQSPFPALTGVIYPNNQISAKLGETLRLRGHNLDGANLVASFRHPRKSAPLTVNAAVTRNMRDIEVTIPDEPQNWSAGVYRLTLSVQRPGESYSRVTNELAVAVAPEIAQQNDSPARDTSDNNYIIIKIDCKPDVLKDQVAILGLGPYELTGGTPIDANGQPVDRSGKVRFRFKTDKGGDFLIRLRVDGVDSLFIDRSVEPPQFVEDPKVTIPP